MANVTPTIEYRAALTIITWEEVKTADTMIPARIEGGAKLASVHFNGTFNGATITLAGSNDETNFATLEDTQGTAISRTTTGRFDIYCADIWIKPTSTGGTSDDVDVVLAMREA